MYLPVGTEHTDLVKGEKQQRRVAGIEFDFHSFPIADKNSCQYKSKPENPE
jgi:hypothetical protein